MPARQSALALMRGLGMTPVAKAPPLGPKASTSSSGSDDAHSSQGSSTSSSSRGRSTSKGSSKGRLTVTLEKAVDISALHADSQVYCLLEVDSTVSRSSSPAGASPSSRSAPACNPVFRYSAQFDVSHDEVDVAVSIYDRHDAPDDDEGGFVGAGRLTLQLSRKGCDREELLALTDRKGAVVEGGILIRVQHDPHKRKRLTPDDFETFEVLGEGAFGTVYRVRKRDTDRIYAMKVLSKARIAKSQTASHVLAERKVLQHSHATKSHLLVGLKFSFQTETHLYLVMDYKSGGELFQHLAANGGRFRDEHYVRFYLAEILLALAALHTQSIVYRDLKPENVLLDHAGHIAICDFGLSKPLDSDLKTRTFCGTGDYLAPETILDEGSGYASDWWAYGILAYEMFNGYTPFYAEDREEKYRMILQKPVKITGALAKNAQAADLVSKLLTRDVSERLGNKGAAEIQAHPFFAGLDWEALAARRISPPFKPPEPLPTPALSPTITSQSSSGSNGGKVPMSRRSSCEVGLRGGNHRPGFDRVVTPGEVAKATANHWHDFSFAAPGLDSDSKSLHSLSSAGSGRFSRASRRSSTASTAPGGGRFDRLRARLSMAAA